MSLHLDNTGKDKIKVMEDLLASVVEKEVKYETVDRDRMEVETIGDATIVKYRIRSGLYKGFMSVLYTMNMPKEGLEGVRGKLTLESIEAIAVDKPIEKVFQPDVIHTEIDEEGRKLDIYRIVKKTGRRVEVYDYLKVGEAVDPEIGKIYLYMLFKSSIM